jgi:hypothetical protein
MMKFTRPITREIELGGERLAVTMGEAGVAFRPVGSRKPPHEVSWAAILCCATGQMSSSTSPESITAALQALRSAPAAASKHESHEPEPQTTGNEVHHEPAPAAHPEETHAGMP